MTVHNQHLFSYAYLERLLGDASTDRGALPLARQVAEWAQTWDLLSARSALHSAVLPTLDALGFAYRADPEDSHCQLLYADASRESILGIVYVAPPDANLDETHQGQHWMFLAVCAARRHEKRWALLTNGAHWRLLDAKHLTPYEVYLDLDLSGWRARAPLAADLARAVWAFLRRDAWLPGDNGRRTLDAIEAASLQTAERAEQHLKSHIESVLGSLCRGFIDGDGRRRYTETDRRAIFESATIAIYRMLFALYAEARGLLPTDQPGYVEHSMRMLVDRAVALQRGQGAPQGTTLWDGLKRLWGWIDRGNPQIGIDPYNGGLFSDDRDDELGHDLSVLRTQSISDAHLSRALVDLAILPADGAPQHIDYRDLAVRHLGTLYEGILEHKLFIVEEPMLARSTDQGIRYLRATEEIQKKTDRLLEVGEVYFAQAPDERKATGSYYTPEYIVDYIVQHTVRAGLEERWQAFAPALAAKSSEERDAALANWIERQALTFRVCDPAMGSGHFLVNTAHTITSFIVETLNAGGSGAGRLDAHPAYWRRRVVGSCLYGVDINPLAVELAKLSLWLTTVERGRPLSFLDHHLRCGNSLVGARLEELPVACLPTQMAKPLKVKAAPEGQLSFFDLPSVREEMAQAASSALALEAAPEQTPDDVHAKAARYAALRQELRRRYGLIADLAVARHLGLDLDDNTFRRLVRGYLDGSEGYVPQFAAGVVQQAGEIARNQRFFHWELEFPQIFSDIGWPASAARPGFDSVIGNPPYGADIPKDEKRLLYGRGESGNTDSAALMMVQAREITKAYGKTGFIIPKAFTYASNWAKLRDVLLPELVCLADVGKGWQNVKLEQVIYVIQRHKQSETYEARHREGEQFVHDLRVPKSACREFGLLINNVTVEELDIARRVKSRSTLLGEIARNSRGATLQQYLVETGPGLRAIGGKQLGRYSISGEKGFVPYEVPIPPNARVEPNAILLQNIVAHIANPVDHIRIIGTMPSTEDCAQMVILDTVNQLTNTAGLSAHFVLGLLLSDLVNWYVYRFIYGGAVRTMHLDGPVTDRIPVPPLDWASAGDREKRNELEVLVQRMLDLASQGQRPAWGLTRGGPGNEIRDLEKSINRIVYDLYGITDSDAEIVSHLPGDR
jgi:hypothetical protein